MAVNDTIFNQLTSENENATTELLANMMKQKHVRNLIGKWLCDDIPDEALNNIKASDVRTQIKTDDCGQPDLIIENGNCKIIVENKIRTRTTLTQHEIDDYIKLLDKNYSKLIFLVPDDYQDKRIDDVTTKNKNVIRKSWTKFLQFLYQMELNKNSEIFSQSLEYLASIIDSSEPLDTILTKQELVMLFKPEEILAVYSLSDKIANLSENFANEFSQSKLGKQYKCKCGNTDRYNVYGIGSYFSFEKPEIDWFVGICPAHFNNADAKYAFSLCYTGKKINLPENEVLDYKDDLPDPDNELKGKYQVFFPLDLYILLSDKQEEQQSEFNRAVEEKILEVMKYKK